jgi:hypothetical protein
MVINNGGEGTDVTNGFRNDYNESMTSARGTTAAAVVHCHNDQDMNKYGNWCCEQR